MTERTRSKGSKTFVWAVMGFLVIGMGGFGLSSAFLSTGGSAVASVGDEDISVDLFFQALRQDTAQASQNFGFQLSLQQAQAFGIDQVTLRRLMAIAALDNEAKSLNLSVGDTAVREELMKNPAFRGLSGGFDTAAYDFALQRIGMTRDEYDAVVRSALTQGLIRQGIADLGAGNEIATQTVMSYIGEIRDFDWVLINADALPAAAEAPTQAELRSFYEANPALFTQPQTRDITYVSLTPEMLAEGVEVLDEEIQREYDAREALYNTPANLILDRIVFGTMEEAQTAADLILSEESTYDDVALNRGLSPADISLGATTEFQLSGAAGDLLFAATEPGVYGPVESDIGPALFRINAIRAAKFVPLEEVRDEIRDAIALNAAQLLVVSAFNDIDDLIAGGVSLEELANETDMQLFSLEFSVENVEGLTAQQVFITEALEAGIDEERDVLESETGGIFALRVDAINEEFIKPLASSRDIAIEGRLAERTQELVLAHAETLKSLIESGADFGATMSINDLTANTATGVSRNSPSLETPPTVAERVFTLEKDELAIVDDINGAYLIRVSTISAYDPENTATDTIASQVEEQITQSISADIFAYFSNAVMSQAGFTVNQPLIDAVINQNSNGAGLPVNTAGN